MLFDRRTLAVLSTALLFAAVLWLVWAARRMVLVFVLAVFFAYLLEPIVERMQAWLGGGRGKAIAVTYLALFGVLAIGAAVAVPRIAAEVPRLTQALPGVADQVTSGQIARQIGTQHGWSYQTQAAAERWLNSHRGDLAAMAQSAGSHAAEVGTNIGWLLLIPVLAIFFLKDKAEFGEAAVDQIDNYRDRTFVRSLIDDLDHMLAQYIRAQLLLALAAALAYTAFLALMRFPFAFALGLAAGILEFIPVVGPVIVAVLLGGIGFFSGYAHWAIVLLFVGVWRVIQDYVNAPYLMGEGLELHPLAAIFGVLVGGEVAGIPGMFLSIPVIAACRIVWRNWRLHGALRTTPASLTVETPAPPRTS